MPFSGPARKRKLSRNTLKVLGAYLGFIAGILVGVFVGGRIGMIIAFACDIIPFFLAFRSDEKSILPTRHVLWAPEVEC